MFNVNSVLSLENLQYDLPNSVNQYLLNLSIYTMIEIVIPLLLYCVFLVLIIYW